MKSINFEFITLLTEDFVWNKKKNWQQDALGYETNFKTKNYISNK